MMNRGSSRSFSSECSIKREHLISGKFPETQLLPDALIAWPDVFDEAKAMLLSAILIYGVVDLRALARKYEEQGTSEQDDYKKIDGFLVKRLLSLPVSAQDIVSHVGKHRAAIQEEIGSDSTDLYLDAFDAIQSNSTSGDLELEFNAVSGRVSLVSFDVVVAEDQFADTELVYAICVDTSQRRITVLFRGCSTRKDWRICASNFLKVQDNPIFTEGGDQPAKIGIHSGYCNYLFNPDTHEGISKFQAIMTHIEKCLISYPGYQVYVTGHSLGAALATVFAFQAAASQQLDGSANVLTCINFASPMVGNLAFETAFRELEAHGRLRCLRVTNHFDIFTQLPDRGNWLYILVCCCGVHLIAYVGWSLLFYLCWQSNVYRHVGMDLHMYDKAGNYKLKHPMGSSKNYAWRVAQDWKKHIKQTFQRVMMVPFVFRFDTNHSAQEHLKRLTGLSSQLEGVFLKDLYATKRFPTQQMKQLESELV